MFTYQGKYTSADIYALDLEEECMKKVIRLCSHPAFEDAKICIMEDGHEGKGACIGFTAPYKGKVIPNIIGVDIGCGVDSYVLDMELPASEKEWLALDNKIRRTVPLGQGTHSKSMLDHASELMHDYDEQYLKKICDKVGVAYDYMCASIGSLGGGNHFIELGLNQHGKVILSIHSGSRNFGARVAEHHQKKALESNPTWQDLAWLEDDAAGQYICDMVLAQRYAKENRRVIATLITNVLGVGSMPFVSSVHNYISERDLIIRKGAVAAYLGTGIIVPMNMAVGSFILSPKQNTKDRNFSAPHGAGRKLSRSKAKKELSLDEFKGQMKGIFTTSLSPKTLDEAPGAYKNPAEILVSLSEYFEIVDKIETRYVLKG